MKKGLLFTIMLMGLVFVKAQTPRVLADKIVGIVGDKIVLRSEIINYIDDIKRQGGEVPPDAECFLLQRMMADKALILQAEKDSLPISDEEIEADIEAAIREVREGRIKAG